MEEVLAPIAFYGVLSVRKDQIKDLRDEKDGRESETYGAHHFWQVSHKRMLAVKSGIISFSATIYSYLDSKVSQTLSGTKKSQRWPAMPKRDNADHLRFLTSLVSITSNSLRM